MRNLGDSLEIWDIVARVSNALEKNCLGLVVNCGTNVLWLVTVDKLGRNA